MKNGRFCLFYLLSSIFINYYIVANLDFNIHQDTNDLLNPKSAGPLGNNSILFDGMYYNWTGYISTAGNWNGNATYTYNSGNIFNVYDYNSQMGTSSYTIDNQTRIVTGGIFGSGVSTPNWIFTNVSISDYVPIAVDGTGNSNFQVTTIQEFMYQGKAYECFVLNYSTSWARYEVNTGILIESYFVFGGSYYYTINLAATNAEFSVTPFNVLAPVNQTYHYSDIPVIVQNKTVLDNVWCRNSTNGGIDWSANYTLNYDDTHYTNLSNLWWGDGYHLLQVFGNTTEGVEFVEEVGFTVSTWGPWIEILSPQDSTYCERAPTLQLDIIVKNYTYAHSAWFRYNTGGGWTQNESLTWNGAEFIASEEFPVATISLQVFANDTLNRISQCNLWFRYSLAGDSVLFDGMYYNWTGYLTGYGNWFGNVSYTYSSGNIFDVTEDTSMGTTSYSINNETRITTGGMFGAGSTPYWIFPNVTISDSAPIIRLNSGDTNYLVTDITTITISTSEYECFVLNFSTSWAFYEINTGILMKSYFDYGGGQNYTINLNATNVDMSPRIKLLNPVNKSYYYSRIPIYMKNASFIQDAWYRDSTNGGLDWSANYSLGFDGSYFTNTSDLIWADGLHLLEVYGKTLTGNEILLSVYFTVDTYGPWIEFIHPQNTTYFATNLTLRLDLVVENFTYADSVWFHYNSGGSWSENQTLEWNTTYFLSSWTFTKGVYHLQIFGNNSLNQIAHRDLWFSVVEIKKPWNYTMTEGYTYTWEDATTGTCSHMEGLDDYSENFALPFTFDFYNKSYNSIFVCTNGFVSFINSVEWNNVPFPSSIYSYRIAPFWSDLKSSNPCNIFVKNLTSPNRVVIEWQNIRTSSDILIGSFEIILFESGDIVFNYDFLNFVPAYTCGLNFGPDTRFFTPFSRLNNSINDFSLLFSYPPNNFVPDLTNTLITPSSGNLTTLFTFNITYSDQDNNGPESVKVVINGTAFNMEQVNSADFNYIDGCEYSYTAYLQVGMYEYYFVCNDGNYILETPIFSGLSVIRTNLSPPLLTEGQVYPLIGYAGTTSFQFIVNYTDQDNNNPTFVNLVLNGSIFAMDRQNLEDCNYLDGCFYTINVTLAPGTYLYYYNCTDGDFLLWTVETLGPTVTIPNTAPQLTFEYVDPQRGNNASIYQFTVTYTDLENNAPSGGVFVYIDGTPHVMNELNVADTNFADGKIYAYTTTLEDGTHQFYFSVSDGEIVTMTEVVNGPSVYDLGAEPDPISDYLVEFFITVIIVAGLIITLETVFLLKRRRRLERQNTKG